MLDQPISTVHWSDVIVLFIVTYTTTGSQTSCKDTQGWYGSEHNRNNNFKVNLGTLHSPAHQIKHIKKTKLQTDFLRTGLGGDSQFIAADDAQRPNE